MPSRLARIAAPLGLSIACASAAWAQTTALPPATPRTSDEFLGTATYRLWAGDAPGAQGSEDPDVPTLTVFRVHTGTGRGSAIVIAPGGAYRGLAANLEGRQVADWFAARGVTAFVLKYASATAISIRCRSSTRGARSGSYAPMRPNSASRRIGSA